jgi:recombination protein RecT
VATQLAERQSASPVAVFRQTLTQPQFREQLRMALPSHIPEDRFIRVALTVVQQSPNLLDGNKVDRQSLFGALMKAAQDGLLPDGREGAIVPYKGKAQWQPMVAGIMTKVRRSGEIASWEVAAVYEKDTFERLLGDDQRIYHKPFEDGDPGKVIGAYSIVTFKDGTKSRDYMPRWRIEKARAQGMAKDSLMWSQFYDEGAIKTVIKHHAKRLPMATDVEAIFERDETMAHVDVERSPAPEPERPLSRLDAIEHQIPDDEPPVESEVIEEQAEALEEEIEQEQPASFSLGEEIDRDEPHPAEAKATEIIAEIEGVNAIVDVNSIVSRYETDIKAMPGEIGAKVEIAADKRKNAIKAARQPAEAK